MPAKKKSRPRRSKTAKKSLKRPGFKSRAVPRHNSSPRRSVASSKRGGGGRRFRGDNTLYPPPIKITLVFSRNPRVPLQEQETLPEFPTVLHAQLEYLTDSNTYTQKRPKEITFRQRLHVNFQQAPTLQTLVTIPDAMETPSLEFKSIRSDSVWATLQTFEVKDPGVYRVRVRVPWNLSEGEQNGFSDYLSPEVTFVSPQVSRQNWMNGQWNA